jgi:non-ribosomal peptide synthetase component E (peptide arylation enzyme)
MVPCVQDVQVVGAPDNRLGEQVAAFIIPKGVFTIDLLIQIDFAPL